MMNISEVNNSLKEVTLFIVHGFYDSTANVVLVCIASCCHGSNE